MRSTSAQACLGFHSSEELASMLSLKQLMRFGAANSTVLALSSPFLAANSGELIIARLPLTRPQASKPRAKG